jgi:hypothetical protein
MLALALLWLIQDPAAPVTLQFRPSEGDKLSVVDSWTHDFRGRMGEDELVLSSRGGRRMRVEMAKVEGGRLARKVVHFEDAYVEEQNPQTGKFIRRDDPLKDRRVTILLRDNREVLEGVDGLPEAARKTLLLEDPRVHLFPGKPVRPGDSWEVTGAQLRRVFASGDFTEGKIDVTLRAVKEIGGRRCAILETKTEVRGKAGTDSAVDLKIAGEVTVWIDRGYVLAVVEKGVLKIKRIGEAKNVPEEGRADVTGEVTATVLEK